MPLSEHEMSIVKGMISRGDRQHDIAAYFGVNGGRIGEISKGTRGIGAGVHPAESEDLPPPGPYMAGRSALRARNTLVALRQLIDEAIKDIDIFESVEKGE
jgi:hypothetical protein